MIIYAQALLFLSGRREALPSDMRSMCPLQHDVQRRGRDVPGRWVSNCFSTSSWHAHSEITSVDERAACFPPCRQVVRCGTRYASRLQGQSEDSGWAGAFTEKLRIDKNVTWLCVFIFLQLVFSSQHRRLSETSISPPGSSIGSPSRVICVSNQWIYSHCSTYKPYLSSFATPETAFSYERWLFEHWSTRPLTPLACSSVCVLPHLIMV